MPENLKSRYDLFDSIPATFLITDVHSQILYANRRAESFFGYAPGEMEGQRMRILFLEEDQIYFLPNIIFLTRYRKGFDGEALLRQKGGKKIFVQLFTSAFKEKGEVFLSFTFQEIQRLKKVEREKREAERWAGLGRMMEEIAHQFRNPIASIGGYSQRVLKAAPSSLQSRSYFNQILKETGRLETILQRVEEYVRIPRLVYKRENIQEAVEAVLGNFAKETKEQGIAIHLNTDGVAGDGQIFFDRDLMASILAHVLQNSLWAITLNPKRKKKEFIEVALWDDGENIEVSVSDRGQGIPLKNLNLIFDPFFSTRPDRVGLGLTFVRRAVEEQGGKIQVKSRPGRGTKVILRFPKDRRRKVRREWISPEVMGRENY
ncbi:MAG: ATP-binding protein [Thermodesulfobacteriota bacterium]|nr:ATP-binding protein [Thermodesulfobacteriota bacterium]